MKCVRKLKCPFSDPILLVRLLNRGIGRFSQNNCPLPINMYVPYLIDTHLELIDTLKPQVIPKCNYVNGKSFFQCRSGTQGSTFTSVEDAVLEEGWEVGNEPTLAFSHRSRYVEFFSRKIQKYFQGVSIVSKHFAYTFTRVISRSASDKQLSDFEQQQTLQEGTTRNKHIFIVSKMQV